MGKKKFDRLKAGADDVAVFRVSGTLGFHENTKVQRLTDECLKRNFRKVLFDFTALSSLGGGVARILREFVNRFEEHGGEVGFIVTNDVVLEFLQDGQTSFYTYGSLEEALGKAIPAGESLIATDKQEGGLSPSVDLSSADRQFKQKPETSATGTTQAGVEAGEGQAAPQNVILMSYDGAKVSPVSLDAETEESPHKRREGRSTRSSSPEDGAAETRTVEARQNGTQTIDSEHVFSEIFGDESSADPPEWIDQPTSPLGVSGMPGNYEDQQVSDLNRKLKRRILELKTLFSIGKDFNAIRDRKKLLDIFLLTSIAQGGVESAVFFERREEMFEPVMSKGVDQERLESISISLGNAMDENDANMVVPLDNFEMDPAERDVLKKAGLVHVCTFRQEGQLAGLILLGKRIAGRGMKREDFEFLKILVTLAQGACENAVLFEREHERTLGIVKTLISLIEENTLLKGTSEFVSRYVGIVAKDMDYHEEDFKDLIYGTVLRDMGMIKVSDLILRSPRDLTKEEWEIIKKHPEDGAAMLSRMKFNSKVVEIVRTHHERFNGEGYPMGLVGKEIPLGARIISVVESYAAMIHERPNRPALSEREALDNLKENYGLRYDREVVQHFAKIMEKEIAKSVRPRVTVE